MKLSIILATLLSNFAITSPDLCADVFLDASGEPITDLVGQTLSRYCKWTGPDAPVWNANVCCTFADTGVICTATTNGRCATGLERMYCGHGAIMRDGRVTCYQPLPDGCEAGRCVDAPDTTPVGQMFEYTMCCGAGGACQYVAWGDSFDCQGEILHCYYGVLNEDGTVECYY